MEKPAVITQELEKFLGEHGIPDGPVRDLLEGLQEPFVETIEHGTSLTRLMQGEQTPARKAIAREVAAVHFPKLQGHAEALDVIGIETVGKGLPKAVHEQLATAAHDLGIEPGTAAPNGDAFTRRLRADDPHASITAPTPAAGARNSIVSEPNVTAIPEPVATAPEPQSIGIEPATPAIPEPVTPVASGGHSGGYTPSYSSSSSYSSSGSVEAAVDEGFFANIGKAFENHGGKIAIGAVIAAVIGGLAIRNRSHTEREADRATQVPSEGFVR